jgi:hypothetical protein
MKTERKLKKPYCAPKLIFHGDVLRITQNKAVGSVSDGAGPRKTS